MDGRPAARSLAGHACDRRRSLALRRQGKLHGRGLPESGVAARCAHELRRPGRRVRVDRAGVGSRLRRRARGTLAVANAAVLRHDGRLDRHFAGRSSGTRCSPRRAGISRPTAGPNSTIASAATSSRPARRPSPAKPPATSRPRRSSSTNRTGRPSAGASRSRARWPRSGPALDGVRPRDGHRSSQIRAELPGRLSFDFAGNGAGFDAKGPWSATIQKLRACSAASARAAAARSAASQARPCSSDVAFALGPARFEANGIPRPRREPRRAPSSRTTCPPSCLSSAAGWTRKSTCTSTRSPSPSPGTTSVRLAPCGRALGRCARGPRRSRSTPGCDCARTASRSRDSRSRTRGFRSTACRATTRSRFASVRARMPCRCVAGGAWDAGRYTLGFEDIAASGPSHRALAPAGRDAPVRESHGRARSIRSASSMRRAASASRAAGNPPATGRSRPRPRHSRSKRSIRSASGPRVSAAFSSSTPRHPDTPASPGSPMSAPRSGTPRSFTSPASGKDRTVELGSPARRSFPMPSVIGSNFA